MLVGISCGTPQHDPTQNDPDIDLPMERLDQVLFQMDTLHLKDNLMAVNNKYPFLSEVLMKQMLALDTNNYEKELSAFIHAYRPIYVAAQKINAPASVHSQLQNLFKHIHYYFPSYKLPQKIIYFIGPLEGFGNAIGSDYMAIGLQMFLGDTSSWYQSEQFQKYFPSYISLNFTPSYIPITAAKNMLQDIAPNTLLTQSLIIEMIELGKRQYVLKKLLPAKKDAELLGYTISQYDAALKAEQDIWSYLLKMNLVYTKDPKVASQLLSEGPFSVYFGNEIPSNIGLFIGYQIVKSWMEQQSVKEQENLKGLLAKPADQIFAESKYKP